MKKRVIPVVDIRHLPASTSLTAPHSDAPEHGAFSGMLTDQLNRPLRDLRISVTDRCNFRCAYCMPKSVFGRDYPFLPQKELLTFEEITRIARIAVSQGIQKVRLTGGEPLLRRHLERLIEQLAALRTPENHPLDLTLTTNGSLLTQKSRLLKLAGLNRITVSLDALDEQVFRRMNDVDFPAQTVLEGIDAAHQAGLGPIKINMVVKRGVNDHQIVPMARYFRDTPFILRYIEYMDVGSTNGWKMDEVFTAADIIATLQQHFPLERIPAVHSSDTAQRWRYTDTGKEIGIIASVTQAFCRDCTRARLSTEGRLFTCLFATQGHDLRTLLRNDQISDAAIASSLATLWHQRRDRYSELRSVLTPAFNGMADKVEMSYIGG